MTWQNRGMTHRATVTGTHGMVASAHPLASLAGVQTLMAGGNAIDAAVATAAALNVVEPYMSGLGGGGAMLLHLENGETTSMLYGGAFPAAASPETLDAPSIDIGPKASTVPGSPAGWFTALERYGTLDPEAVLAPAIRYAEEGVALTVNNSAFYLGAQDRLDDLARLTFTPGGAFPGPGAIIRQPELAETYRTLARDGVGAFYDGPIGEAVIAAIREAGGIMTQEDLGSVEIQTLDISTSHYRGYELRAPGWPITSYEIQLTLNILEGFDLAGSGPGTAETLHRFFEALKLSATERVAYAGKDEPPPAGLLSSDFAADRRSQIDLGRATPFGGERYMGPAPDGSYTPGTLAPDNTTHFDVIDEAGNAVSITQSIGAVFGSGMMAGETGIMLNNFLFFFDLDPESPNVISGGRTVGSGPLSPTMLFRDGKLFLMIGTPGAFGIPQTTAQMISNVVDHQYGVQAAIEAPRVRAYSGLDVLIEDRIPAHVRQELARRGHQIQLLEAWSPAVGGGQGILVDPESGAYSGGADPRRDGYAIGF